MAKAKMNGSGWHSQSVRHSNAKRFGKAGGYYALARSSDMTGKIIKTNKIPTQKDYPDYGFAEGKYKTKKEAEDRLSQLHMENEITEERHQLFMKNANQPILEKKSRYQNIYKFPNDKDPNHKVLLNYDVANKVWEVHDNASIGSQYFGTKQKAIVDIKKRTLKQEKVNMVRPRMRGTEAIMDKEMRGLL